MVFALMTGCSQGNERNFEDKTSTAESKENAAEEDLKEAEESSEVLSSEGIQENESKETESFKETEEVNDTAVLKDYIVPDSSSRYLRLDEVKNLSKEEFRIARNEIYARHGRKFNSKDLQDYFNHKSWYQGTVEPEQFDEGWLNDYEKENIQLLTKAEETASFADLPEAPSKPIIDRYGYEDGYSVLSFRIKEGTLKDCGEYYQVDAVYRQRIEAPANLSDGSEVTLVFNELTGETKTLVYREGYFYFTEKGYQYEYYCLPSSDGNMVVLYEGSDDRVDKPVYEGKLYIRKDATDEVAIMNQIEPVTEEILNRDNWYNGVYFDQKGYVTRLVFYGD